jgi:hypothetical protein
MERINLRLNIIELYKQKKVHQQIISYVFGLKELQEIKHKSNQRDWKKIDQECSNRRPTALTT